MADQEFLASFGVDIDESGVNRLESIMETLKSKAEETASSFEKANSAVSGFPTVTPETGTSGDTQPSSSSTSSRSLTDAFSSVFSGIYDSSIGMQASLQSLFNSTSGLTAGLDLTDAEASLSDLFSTAESHLELSADLDLSDAESGLSDLVVSTENPLELSADVSSAVSSAEDALSSIRSLFSSADLSLNVKVNTVTGGNDGSNNPSRKMSTGGRFTTPSSVEVAEDGGTEYIIPLKSESVAVPLLRSLFGELSGSAKESLLSALSPVSSLQMDVSSQNNVVPTVAGTALSSLPNLLSAAPGATSISVLTNNTNNVQAPVNIQVTASGSDPEVLGRSIYDSAERYLLKSLQSVFE